MMISGNFIVLPSNSTSRKSLMGHFPMIVLSNDSFPIIFQSLI